MIHIETFIEYNNTGGIMPGVIAIGERGRIETFESRRQGMGSEASRERIQFSHTHVLI